MIDNCPKCNSANTGSSFCPTCGFQLQSWDLTNKHRDGDYSELENNNLCSNCSYLLTHVHRSCPNCGIAVERSNRFEDTDQIKEREPINSDHATLRAVSLENVKHNDVILNKDIIVLNREKIDPSDKSISVEEHALLYKQDGNWFISNKASNKALFVQLESDLQLRDGALLLLGNSKFYKFQL